MKVLIADPLDPASIEKIKKGGHQVEDLSTIPREEIINKVVDFDVMTVRSATKVRKDMIDKMQKMKLIVRGGVGVDNIDVEYAKTKGIQVKNTPAASSASVAELAVAHMFALSRHICRGTQGIKTGLWEKKTIKGIELAGKTMGIIGLGRIGQELAKRAKALGMKVIGYDPYVKSSESVDLNTLFAQSDFISLHLPLTPETKHLVNREAFAKMKDGVIIVNCARGGVIDESALLEALKSNKVAGAGLDVFETEPPQKTELMDLPNVTFTPHIGAQTKEATKRVGGEVADIILNFKS